MIFLPYPDYVQIAETLDYQTLAEQFADALYLLEFFHQTDRTSDPDPRLVAMWEGHEVQLAYYAETCAKEYVRRMNVDKAAELDRIGWHLNCAASGDFNMAKPKWWGDMAFHYSEQARLIRERDCDDYYVAIFDVNPQLAEVWPSAS